MPTKTLTALPVEIPAGSIIGELGSLCGRRGLADLATRLGDLDRWIEEEMKGFETALTVLPRGPSAVSKSAHHLLELGGKHLRPMCLVLAAKAGSGFGSRARHLAVAIELIHNATLLHDDVVDSGEHRRGATTARMIYGNAASIFAGDWLLIEALKRIRRAAVAGVLDRALDTIDEMIAAEALQLENRGWINPSRTDYFRIIDGKTAALFRLALWAGATHGGLTGAARLDLEAYGAHLGVAFQLIDDLLDFTGDPAATGKDLFADLAEGRMTYPLILALERDPALRTPVESALARTAGEAPFGSLYARIRRSLDDTGAARDCLALAQENANEAVSALQSVPEGPARRALETVAEAALFRIR